MKAYPFGIPPVAGIAVSASLAATASFLSATIPTASLALNLSGPQGPSGSNVEAVGAVGPQGATGPTGPAGLGIYLVTGSLALCCPVETTNICLGDIARETVADGTHNASGCIQIITDNECGPGGCAAGFCTS